MEKDRRFNFKLLVPPRVNTSQVSAVRPQEIIKNSGGFMNTLQQGYTMGFDKERNPPFPNTSMVTPSKPTRQDLPKMTVVPPMEKDENNCSPVRLYSKLFDEVEKIKSWKVNIDSDIVQKERRLQDNKRTIETQRKAIQELQFGNESLSVKLEEQISENEDLKNKNNATRNLCNILKDTFQRSSEKMHLFDSEREETHHLFMENSESIQKLIAAFESLRIRVEADQQEMQKVKEGLLQFEELKEKYHQEYDLKEEEVAGLQKKLKNKDNELQKIVLDLLETQKHCKQLQEATNQQNELLKCSKTEQDSLLKKLHIAEQHCEETQKSHKAIAAALEQSKEEHAQIIQSKDLSIHELSRAGNQQAEKLQTAIQELQNSLALEIQRAQELQDKLMANNEELERRNTLLRETIEQNAKKEGQIKILANELDIKSKSIESMKGKIDISEVRLEELTAKLSRKTEEVQLFKNEAEMASAENDLLKKACEAAEKAQEDLKENYAVTEIKVQELEGELFSEMRKNKEKVVKLTKEIQRLEEENQCLREEVNSIKTKIQGKCHETETLQKKMEESWEHLHEKITEKEKLIKYVETKLCNLRKKFEIKLKAQEEYRKENKILKKQIAKETANSSQLENVISSLHKEFQSLKRLNEEGHQKLLKDLEYKSTFAAECENEVQKLRLTAAEAIKNKEDAELKCQHKIADMVALMEKHKSQYDRMVEEKDAELDENKKREAEAVAHTKSLELELLKHRTENDQLKKQLKTETTKMENLQKELTDLKKEMSSMKITQVSGAANKQGTCSETPKEGSSKRLMFDFSKARTTPSYKYGGAAAMKHTESVTESIRTPCGTTPKTKGVCSEDLKTPRSITHSFVGTSKIKSYRIRTPPSGEKVSPWGKGTIELDPKSDSSDQNDLLTFANVPAPSFCAPHGKIHAFKKIQSPVTHKSPGNTLKLAAIKRMRDAGWTAVTGSDKKKKKNNEKIFA